MKIVYLDQNQWIRLARAWKYPSEDTRLRELVEKIERGVLGGTLCLPLTATNLYETYKINDPEKRKDLSIIQSKLSRGIVFAGRHKRLASEISTVVRSIQCLPIVSYEKNWFLSDLFFEAFAEHGDDRTQLTFSESLLEAMRANPADFLFDYLVRAPNEERQLAVKQWSVGSEELQQRVERRRQKFQNEPMEIRRRAYSAALMIDELEIILKFARDAGASWQSFSDIGSSNARRLIEEVPAYHIECELALKLEAQNRPIEENDFRDMATFCATVPYADFVISENMFVNLAHQARLNKHFDTIITTDLMEISQFL
jgi:hypothetical protein